MQVHDQLAGMDAQQLREFAAGLIDRVARQDQELRNKQLKIEQLTHEMAVLRRWKFAARSEQLHGVQGSLLEESIDADLGAIGAELAALRSSAPAQPPKEQPKRTPLPAHLPRVEVRHEPQGTVCRCGCAMKRIGEDVSEKLDYTPGVFVVERHIRGKWACAKCQMLIQAPVPAAVIDKGATCLGSVAAGSKRAHECKHGVDTEGRGSRLIPEGLKSLRVDCPGVACTPPTVHVPYVLTELPRVITCALAIGIGVSTVHPLHGGTISDRVPHSGVWSFRLVPMEFPLDDEVIPYPLLYWFLVVCTDSSGIPAVQDRVRTDGKSHLAVTSHVQHLHGICIVAGNGVTVLKDLHFPPGAVEGMVLIDKNCKGGPVGRTVHEHGCSVPRSQDCRASRLITVILPVGHALLDLVPDGFLGSVRGVADLGDGVLVDFWIVPTRLGDGLDGRRAVRH
jgi:hypothetical protein